MREALYALQALFFPKQLNIFRSVLPVEDTQHVFVLNTALLTVSVQGLFSAVKIARSLNNVHLCTLLIVDFSTAKISLLLYLPPSDAVANVEFA